VHGLIFFYLQKFADVAAAGSTSWKGIRSNVTTSASRFLPAGTYPDTDAVAILSAIADATTSAYSIRARPVATLLVASSRAAWAAGQASTTASKRSPSTRHPVPSASRVVHG
jgi:hypothetical protein